MIQKTYSGLQKFMTIISSVGLLLYIIFLAAHQFLPVSDYPILSFFLVLWFIALIGVSRRSEWARKLIIVLAFFMSLYLIFGMENPTGNQIALILIFVMLILTYMLPKTRMQFNPTRKVLIVDDDRVLQKIVQAALIHKGVDVLTADTGEMGLELAQQKQPDLIILDVILPGIKGRSVCAKLKADPLTRSIPVIFLTAKDSPDDVEAEMAAGALSHMTKPVNPQKLIAEINRILR